MWSLPDPKRTPNQSQCVLNLGDVRFAVDPSVGGRIVEFSLGGLNVLSELEDLGEWTNGGSTFWTSPQSDWAWPPPATVDRDPYALKFDDSTQRLSLESGRFTVKDSTLAVTKHFTPNLERQSVDIEYVVHNHSQHIRLAGWEVSRVAAQGMTYFLGRDRGALGGLPRPTVELDQSSVWMDHSCQTREAKLGADASSSFVAYASRPLLFLKAFEHLGAGAPPVGEAEIELYVMPERYVEIEQQSAEVSLKAGDSLSYRVSWFLRRLPEDIMVRPMNPRLLQLARMLSGGD